MIRSDRTPLTDRSAATPIRFHELAGRLQGDQRSGRTPIVLLHGLTFDRRMWDPVLAALPADRCALALDLPAHGGSPGLHGRGLAPVVEAVRAAVEDAGLERPVMVGHSVGGPIASIYASEYATAAVVSIEAPLRVERFAEQVRAMAPLLAGPGFDRGWARFRESFGLPLLTAGERALLRAGDQVSGEVVLRYQADLLERPVAEVVRWHDHGLHRIRLLGIPYVALFANEVDARDQARLAQRVPQAEVVVWPVRHHFPHVSEPVRFARLIEGLATAADDGTA